MSKAMLTKTYNAMPLSPYFKLGQHDALGLQMHHCPRLLALLPRGCIIASCVAMAQLHISQLGVSSSSITVDIKKPGEILFSSDKNMDIGMDI